MPVCFKQKHLLQYIKDPGTANFHGKSPGHCDILLDDLKRRPVSLQLQIKTPEWVPAWLKDQEHTWVSCTSICPSHRAGRKCLVGQRDVLCWWLPACTTAPRLTHDIPAVAPEAESSWQTEKPEEPQCLPATSLFKSWRHSKVKQTGCPFGCLPTYSGGDPSPQPQTSIPHLAGVNGKQPLDGEVALQKEAIYRLILRNGVSFWRMSLRNQDKSFHQARRKWGSLQTGLSQAFREALGMQSVWTLTSLFSLLCCCQKKVLSGKGGPGADSRAAAGLYCPQRPPVSLLSTASPFPIALGQPFWYDHPSLFRHSVICFTGIAVSQSSSLYGVTCIWSFTQLAMQPVQGTY